MITELTHSIDQLNSYVSDLKITVGCDKITITFKCNSNRAMTVVKRLIEQNILACLNLDVKQAKEYMDYRDNSITIEYTPVLRECEKTVFHGVTSFV